MRTAGQIASTLTSQQEQRTTTGSVDKDLVNQFFKFMEAIYGAAKCNAQWPNQDAQRAAKQVWGPEICKYSWGQLHNKLIHAQCMQREPEWRFPNIGQILSGSRQPGAAGQAALSYRPVDEVMGLPAPERDKTKGNAILKALREAL